MPSHLSRVLENILLGWVEAASEVRERDLTINISTQTQKFGCSQSQVVASYLLLLGVTIGLSAAPGHGEVVPGHSQSGVGLVRGNAQRLATPACSFRKWHLGCGEGRQVYQETIQKPIGLSLPPVAEII